METNTKEVNFRLYCPKCKNYSLKSDEEPCNECLTQGFNYDSHKPIKFEEASSHHASNDERLKEKIRKLKEDEEKK